VQHGVPRGLDFQAEAAVAVHAPRKGGEISQLGIHLGAEVEVGPPVGRRKVNVAEAQGGGGRRLAGLVSHVVFVAEGTIQIDSSNTYIYSSMLLSCWWVIVSSLGIVSLGEFY